ncbi:MAG TPA: FAD-dependent oxidoreductase, partial [Planctomycetota bacterium]|nr:FAD-dependent oxidoreductase [Planctomycetota bacterium]
MNAIVVGAGIVGAACAEALALDGWRVRVLEARRPAHGVTAAGMGHVLVLDDSEAQFALTRLSRALWDAREWPEVVEREVCGTLWVAADGAELAHARARATAWTARDLACEVLDERALREAEPSLRAGLAGALLVPGDSVVYPPTATEHLLERARVHGAEIECGAAARRVGDGWVLTEDGRRLETDAVVVAAGLATPTLLDECPLGLVVRPKRGHLAITERAPGFLRHQLVELSYVRSAHGGDATSVAFNVQPRRTGQVLVGSSRELDADANAVDAELLARMLARAVEYLPGLAELAIVRAWTGLRPATDDHLPFVGPVPGAPRLWVAAGHEGLGIATSLGSARLVADGLAGRTPPIDAAPYGLARRGN